MSGSIDYFNTFFGCESLLEGTSIKKGVIWWGTGLRFVC